MMAAVPAVGFRGNGSWAGMYVTVFALDFSTLGSEDVRCSVSSPSWRRVPRLRGMVAIRGEDELEMGMEGGKCQRAAHEKRDRAVRNLKQACRFITVS